MKSSNLVIRTLRMLPEVYSDESRDFLVFTRLMDAVYNSCKYNTDTIQFISDPRNIDSKLLKLLADKLGIDTKDSDLLLDTELRMILRSLPQLMRNKGSLKALVGLINIYFKIYHIQGDYKLSISNEGTIVLDITLGKRTIVLGIETLKQSITLLEVMSKYLLPPGYSFFVYFYTEVNGISNLLYEDNLTLLYTSNVLNATIDQEIPDFIRDAVYRWTDSNILAEEGTLVRNARGMQLISALDAREIGNLYSAFTKEFFMGYIKNEDKSTIIANYAAATTYDPERDPNQVDNPTNPYKKLDVALHGTQHKIFIPEYKFINFEIKTTFDTYTAATTLYDLSATLYDETAVYKKDDQCIYNNALYKAVIAIKDPETWTTDHWEKLISDGEYILINADENHDNDATFYKYDIELITGTLQFKLKQPYQLCWRTFELKSLVITDEKADIETGYKTVKNVVEPIMGTSIGELYFVTTYNDECLLNKLTFKGSYKITDNLNPYSVLNNLAANEFDYCCLFNEESAFLYNIDTAGTVTETQLIQRNAVTRLPMESVVNHLRYNMSDANYYVGITNALYNKNEMDYYEFNQSLYINDVAFIVSTEKTEETEGTDYKKRGIVTVDGTAYGYTRFTIESGITIAKDHVYILLGCPENGSEYTYFMESDSAPFADNSLRDFGNTCIAKAVESSDNARINIILRDKIEVTQLKFTPELFDLTEYLGITEVVTFLEVVDKLWKKVNQGAMILNLYVPEIEYQDNTVLWRRGGDYFIKYRTSAGVEPTWQKYTYPLFFVKLIQTRSY